MISLNVHEKRSNCEHQMSSTSQQSTNGIRSKDRNREIIFSLQEISLCSGSKNISKNFNECKKDGEYQKVFVARYGWCNYVRMNQNNMAVAEAKKPGFK